MTVKKIHKEDYADNRMGEMKVFVTKADLKKLFRGRQAAETLAACRQQARHPHRERAPQ